MKRRELIKVLFFYVLTVVAMAAVMWVVFENFGYSGENFLVVVAMLLPLAVVFGYLLSKIALEPLFVTNDMLDRLLKDTLHELNVPLATVMANVTLLQRREKDEKKLRRLARIEEAAENLKELYEDLDYFIKKEIGTVEREVCDLGEIVEASIRAMEEIRGDISIQYDKKRFLVKVDRRGCRKAVDNLVSNAIKYNKKEGKVGVRFEKNALVVEDTGIGMDETTLFHIFDRYYRNDTGASGYGIGLHIVKTFCDEHGIRVEIESKPGIGTLFRLDFSKVKEEGQSV